MSEHPRFVARLEHVSEVTLCGSADLGYWREELAGRGLAPAAVDGDASLLVMGAEGVFRGLRFREINISVMLEPEGAYLVQGFNSRRVLAWSERFFSSTPYAHGDVRVAATRHAAIAVAVRGKETFRAEMEVGRAPVSIEPDRWAGVVHLPSGKLFHAEIEGETARYPFLPSDSLFVAESLTALAASSFRGREWMIRPDARHARSKTYPRRP